MSRQVRSKVRGLLCLLCLSSLNKTRLLPFNFPNKPTAGPSPGLLSKRHVPAPSIHAHWQTPVLGWGVQGCGPDHLCRSHSVLSVTDQLLDYPLNTQGSPLLQLIFLLVRGPPQTQGSLHDFGSPRGCRYHPASSPLPSPFHPTHHVGVSLVLLGAQGPLLVFGRCSVVTASRVDVSLIHLWGERNSMSSYSSHHLGKSPSPF